MPQYQGIWNLAQQAQALTTQQWVTDPLFDYTTLLLQGDNTTGSAQNNLFLDSSPNQFAITRNGNTTQGTFSPFSQSPGWWSNAFASSASLLLGTTTSFTYLYSAATTFTFECFFYANSVGTTQTIAANAYSTIANGFAVLLNTSVAGDIEYRICRGVSGDQYKVRTTGPVFVPGQWNHLAITYDATAGYTSGFTIYVNGVARAVTYTYTSTSFSTGAAQDVFRIATSPTSGGFWPFDGYISNLRVVSGARVYTSNFAPPTSPLGIASSGTTTVLTCQSNRFVDNSSSPFTVSIANTPSVQAFSPLAPQYQYTPTVTGGSGYFDGTGDTLSVADNAALELGASNFCIEMYVYKTTTSTTNCLVNKRANNTTADGFTILLVNNVLTAYFSSASGAWNIISGVTFGTISLNTWNHVAVYRVGNAWYGALNGVVTTLNASNSSAVNNNTAAVTFGGEANGIDFFYGNISSTRIVVGSSVYTASNFTPPTAPLTPITNTSLLLNFTNAGIYDGTLKNNLETVGNAQVSTSVVKYGSGSLYFDGTGDYLRPNSGYIFNFGTGDFTIEFWAYLNVTTNQCFIDCRPGSAGDYVLFDYNTSAIRYYVNTTTVITGPSLASSVWNHIALTRANGTVRLFVNGTLTNTATNTANLGSAANPYIGSNYVPGDYLNAYIDDMRITKGIARYTRNFTPPTVALPRQ